MCLHSITLPYKASCLLILLVCPHAHEISTRMVLTCVDICEHLCILLNFVHTVFLIFWSSCAKGLCHFGKGFRKVLSGAESHRVQSILVVDVRRCSKAFSTKFATAAVVMCSQTTRNFGQRAIILSRFLSMQQVSQLLSVKTWKAHSQISAHPWIG